MICCINNSFQGINQLARIDCSPETRRKWCNEVLRGILKEQVSKVVSCNFIFLEGGLEKQKSMGLHREVLSRHGLPNVVCVYGILDT